tara:strand:+ start:275 stop:397 length:123 start_codon:yes stop_codon:yes gene_type:complete
MQRDRHASGAAIISISADPLGLARTEIGLWRTTRFLLDIT